MAQNPEAKDSTKVHWAPYIAALIFLIIFAFFVWYMLGLTRQGETEWTRAVYIFTGVESIAFAAAGFLFGKEVHRAQAENADKRANQAEQKANTAEGDAAKGKALAAAIKARAKPSPGKVSSFAAVDKNMASPAYEADLEPLKNMADQLFPDL